ncbi:MAG: hypothetical protein HDR22_02100 [Lachnospiraceae bacterium]|nr:hypothetical protein [Lachnospiraceae bacterium]
MDEKPYQLLRETREPLPMRPGDDWKVDSEYIRNGTCSTFAFIESLAGRHHVSVREHRTAADWEEEIHYTPKHGSWLNIAEIELNVMTRQCLTRRIDNIHHFSSELSTWESECNTMAAKVDWQFKTSGARIKLSSLYPKFTAAYTEVAIMPNINVSVQ